jgi:putative FmdB family regulatory protein
MPMYEFMCESCKKSFTVTLTISERANAKARCPSCGSAKVTPQLTTFTAKTSRKS